MRTVGSWANSWKARSRTAVGPTERPDPRSRFGRALSPACGLEALDQMGIDIDQDPRAFAKFLELRNRIGDRQ